MEFIQEDCDYNISKNRSLLTSMGIKDGDINKKPSV